MKIFKIICIILLALVAIGALVLLILNWTTGFARAQSKIYIPGSYEVNAINKSITDAGYNLKNDNGVNVEIPINLKFELQNTLNDTSYTVYSNTIFKFNFKIKNNDLILTTDKGTVTGETSGYFDYYDFDYYMVFWENNFLHVAQLEDGASYQFAIYGDGSDNNKYGEDNEVVYIRDITPYMDGDTDMKLAVRLSTISSDFPPYNWQANYLNTVYFNINIYNQPLQSQLPNGEHLVLNEMFICNSIGIASVGSAPGSFGGNGEFTQKITPINIITAAEKQGLQEGYNFGITQSTNDGYENGYNAGYEIGEQTGFNNGYNYGYAAGQLVGNGGNGELNMAQNSIATIIKSVFSAMDIKLFGIISVLDLLTIAVVFAIVLFIIKLIRGN